MDSPLQRRSDSPSVLECSFPAGPADTWIGEFPNPERYSRPMLGSGEWS